MNADRVPHVTLPPGAAVAAVYGHVGRSKAGIGIAMIVGLDLRLRGIQAPERFPDRWLASAFAAEAGLAMARERGVRHLRILLENCEVGRIVSGVASPRLRERAPSLGAALEAFAREGGHAESVAVQGGTETLDLPSRLNDLSHVLAGCASQGGPTDDACAMAEGWDRLLVARRPELRQTRILDRQGIVTSRKGAADFLGVGCGMVDVLLRAGHLDLTQDGAGVTRRSLTRVYEEAQRLRHDEFFGGWRCAGEGRQAAE